jgi:hypothetical protein
MKRILFPGLLVAGLLISLSGFSQRYYGRHGGFGFPHPRVFVRPIPAPIIYGPVYPRVYAPAYGYGYGRSYYYPQYHRPFYGHPNYRGRSWHR